LLPSRRRPCASSQRASIGRGMHRLAPFVLAVSVPILSAACVADVADAPDEAAVGSVGELGLHRGYPPDPKPPDPVAAAHAWRATHSGPCADACWGVWTGRCEACMEGDEDVACAGATLTCIEAEHALGHGLVGVSSCWRSCEGLH
jgi:hypothetical protein